VHYAVGMAVTDGRQDLGEHVARLQLRHFTVVHLERWGVGQCYAKIAVSLASQRLVEVHCSFCRHEKNDSNCCKLKRLLRVFY
jgi:hypothetical protein